ncbi:type VI secretion system-associated FHA domain protein TagH [Reyranella sp.]|jgi:type VI secretion system protein ImpI/type VI secretion system protein|uniref:type VI secretion system-associated FHA domain protein TagH n=1 Tax=Reyranella sp. TaxID=1929291 RepID=UPI002F923FBD
MIRCPDNVAPQRREVRGGELSIGRGQDNDWIIPDPERHLSKRHCRLTYGLGDWELHDLSTNGTFLNQASEPVGRGTAQKLRNGDRIKFGLYEIEVTIDDEGEGAAFDDGRVPAGGRSEVAMRDADLRSYSDGGLPGTGSMSDDSNSPILPADFDPLAANQEPFRGPTQPDHAHALESAFRPPPAPAAIIPDDWDVDLPGTSRPRVAQSPPPLPPSQPQEHAAPPQPRQEHLPVAQAGFEAGLAAAFLRGVGLKDAALTEPEKTLERIGAAMRATVNGLRQTLMARASVKDVFRIEQTMIRASGNNPLKFSLDDDDALATLLGTGRRGGMAPEEAIAEAFDDLRMHELATVSAMQEAVRVLLAQFEPDSVERKAASNALQIHPAQRKARAWDAFVQLHKSVTQALSDDFDSVFGKAFARAYEQAIDKLGGDRKGS